MKTLQRLSCAIQTRYIGPANYRGSRIKAFFPSDFASDSRPRASMTVSYNDALDSGENHTAAALALAKREKLYALENPKAALVENSIDSRGNVYFFVLVD
jgi:hypothetical protein